MRKTKRARKQLRHLKHLQDNYTRKPWAIFTRDVTALKHFIAQAGLCHLCGQPMVIELGQPNSVTLDHIVPAWKARHDLQETGIEHRNNKKGACWACNQDRAGRILSDREQAAA